MSGKGSAPRPFSVSNEEYANRWDAIFQRDKRKEEDAKIELELLKESLEKTPCNSSNKNMMDLFLTEIYSQINLLYTHLLLYCKYHYSS